MYQQIIAKIRKEFQNISADSEEEIQRAVDLILKELPPDKDKRYPLPVVRLLKSMGFDLYRSQFENPNQSGLIAVDSSLPEKNHKIHSDRVILVNQEDSVAHQRFTIAHELAHYLFDFDEAAQPTYYKAYLTTELEDARERRANRFAAELLMPTEDFKKQYQVFKAEQGSAFSLSRSITLLSQYFDSPVTSVKRRLQETGLFSEGV